MLEEGEEKVAPGGHVTRQQRVALLRRGCADRLILIMCQGTCDKPSHSQISNKISYLIQSD